MLNIELPINTNPPLKCYLNEAHNLGIIFSQSYEKCLPWLLNHYYNFEYINDDKNGRMLTLNPFTWTYYVEWVYNRGAIILPSDVLKKNMVEQTIESMLKKGYYCIGNFNEKYVPGYLHYNNSSDYYHQYMIFSANIKEKTFGTFGYSKNQKLEKIYINYNDFYSALSKTKDNIVSINFLSLNKKFNYNCFDLDFFIFRVKQYINEKNNPDSSINQFIKEIKDIKKNKTRKIDVRAILTFYEHKFLMLERLKYLFFKNILKNYDYIIEYSEQIKKSEIVRNLTNKFNMLDKKEQLIDKIVYLISDIMIKDEEILNKVIHDIT